MSRLLVPLEQARVPGQKQFEMNGWIASAPFEDLVGIRILEASNGRAVLELPFTVKLSQGGGVLHGGALTTLADTAVAMAIKSLLPDGTVFATTSLAMEFIAAVKEGEVRAEASITGPEGREFHGTALLKDHDGRIVAKFCSRFKVARDQGFAD